MRLIDADALIKELSKAACGFEETVKKAIEKEKLGHNEFTARVLNISACTTIKEVVIPEIKKQSTVNQWIPCSERLPEDGKIVLVSLEGERECNIEIAKFEDTDIRGTDRYYFWTLDDYCFESEDVVAWMPLPEPYKEEQK